jgi:hypothetical protein
MLWIFILLVNFDFVSFKARLEVKKLADDSDTFIPLGFGFN